MSKRANISRGHSAQRTSRCIATAAVATLLGSSAFADSVTDWHTFKNAPAAPLAGQGTDDPVIGTLTDTADASFVIGYLANTLTTTNIGDQITLRFGVRFDDSATFSANAGDNFRFALFDENGQSRVTADTTATAGVDGQTDNFRGYIFGVKNGTGTGNGGSTREKVGPIVTGDNTFATAGANAASVSASQGVGGDHVVLTASINGDNTGATYFGTMTITKTAAGAEVNGGFFGTNGTVANLFTFNDTAVPPPSGSIGAVGFLVGDALNVEQVSLQDVNTYAVAGTAARYWDVNGATAGAGGAAPAGNWNYASLNFNTDSTGGGAGQMSSVTPATSDVIFAAGADGTGPYTVTVTGTQKAASIQVPRGDVTLVGSAAGGTLAVSSFNVASGATATVQAAIAGDASTNLSKTGGGTLVLDGTHTYTGTTTVAGGRLQATKAAALPGYNQAGKVFVNDNTTLGINVGLPTGQWTDTQINDLYTNATFGTGTTFAITTNGGNFSYGFPMGKNNALTKDGANTLTLTAANTYTGGTRVNAGSLAIGHPDALGTGALNIADGAMAVIQASLPAAVSVASVSTNTTGSLDMTSGSMVVKNSNHAAIQALVISGYAGSAWNGPGINSSVAAADPNFVAAVGYASNADAFYTEFQGVTVDSDDILVRSTYLGDSDLNGDTNLDDFPLFTAGLEDDAVGGPDVLTDGWFYGDYDYNGVTNLDDFPLFTYGLENDPIQLAALADLIEMSSLSAGHKSAMLGMLAAVPEPATLALFSAAACGGLLRRRRHDTD